MYLEPRLPTRQQSVHYIPKIGDSKGVSPSPPRGAPGSAGHHLPTSPLLPPLLLVTEYVCMYGRGKPSSIRLVLVLVTRASEGGVAAGWCLL